MADKKEKVGFFGAIKNFFKGIGKRFKDIKSEMKRSHGLQKVRLSTIHL